MCEEGTEGREEGRVGGTVAAWLFNLCCSAPAAVVRCVVSNLYIRLRPMRACDWRACSLASSC